MSFIFKCLDILNRKQLLVDLLYVLKKEKKELRQFRIESFHFDSSRQFRVESFHLDSSRQFRIESFTGFFFSVRSRAFFLIFEPSVGGRLTRAFSINEFPSSKNKKKNLYSFIIIFILSIMHYLIKSNKSLIYVENSF